MLDARQIRDAEFIKNNVKRRAKVEAQQFLERTAGAMEQLQNDNASVRAENIELGERCARLAEVNEKLLAEKDELLQKLSESAESSGAKTSDFANNEIAVLRTENAALSEENARLKELNAKLAEENDRLIQRPVVAEPDNEDAIAVVRAENAELSEYNARLKELIEKLADEKDELLQKQAEESEEQHDNEDAIAAVRAQNEELSEENARLKELNDKLEDEKDQLIQKLAEEPDEVHDSEDAITAVRTENAQICEENARLKEQNTELEGEKEQLIQKLANAVNAASKPAGAPVYTESERIIKAAQDKANLILEKAERDYLLKMTRANAVITQKTIAAELEFRDNLRKLKTADGELRELKAQLTKLLGEMPDGLGENAAEIIDRLKNQQQ